MSTAVDFLKAFDPDGWHNLVSIEPGTRAVRGVTIAPGEWAKAEAFVEQYNGKRNLYFSVNEPRPGAPDDKLKKVHIANIRAVYADVDPGAGDVAAAREAIIARAHAQLTQEPPNLIIDSGGGLQFFWQVPEKLPVDDALRETVENQARGIAHIMEGDGVCNIDRVMRLPGTQNLPDAKKRARGRVAAPAVVMKHKPYRTALAALAGAYPSLSTPDGTDRDAGIADAIKTLDMGYVQKVGYYDELDADLRQRFEAARDRFPALDRLWSGEAPPKDSSSSGWVFSLGKFLKQEGGFTAEEFGALCWVWDRADYNKIDARLLARAWERAPAGADTGLLDALPDDPENSPKSKKFTFEDFDDVVTQSLECTPALIDGFLDQGAMSIIYGDSNAGKTFIAMDISFHVGAGLRYAGMDTTKGLVVYVAAEGGQGAKKRLRALRRKFPNAQVDFLLLVSPVDLRRPDADLKPLIEALLGIGRPIALIVIDTLSRAMAGGDENSSVDMGAMVKHFDLLRKATVPAHLSIVHHTGKDKAKGARGHSLLRAATDTEIEVEGAPDVLTGTIRVTKQRDMDGNWSSGFRRVVHVLGQKPNGKDITSCTIELMGWEEAKALTLKPTEKERAVLSGIALLRDESGDSEFSTDDIAKIVTDDLSKAGVEAVRKNLARMVTKGFLEKRGRNKWANNSDILPLSELNFAKPHTDEADNSDNETDKGIFD